VSHDVLGCRQTGHYRQHHVHRNHVWSAFLTDFDRALAILGLAGQFDLRISRKDLEETLSDCQRIFNDKNACLLHRLSRQRVDHRQELGLIELALDDVALGADILTALTIFGRSSGGHQDRGDFT
jgi:hypothetical protein